jgi:hypothetical protein
MSTTATKAPRTSHQEASLGPILADAVYPLPVFMRLAGLDERGMRHARRRGLKVIQVGRRRYVRGVDFHEYLEGVVERARDSESFA